MFVHVVEKLDIRCTPLHVQEVRKTVKVHLHVNILRVTSNIQYNSHLENRHSHK